MNFIAFRLQPHNHSKKVAKFYYATPELVQKAITTSLEAKKEWERVPLEDRMQMYLRVADQMAGEYRLVSMYLCKDINWNFVELPLIAFPSNLPLKSFFIYNRHFLKDAVCALGWP